MLRCLFAGLGGIGQRHMRNLRTLLGGDVEFVAYRVRGEREVLDDRLRVVQGEDLIEKYAVRVFSNLSAALATRPQLAFITNPTSLHLPVALSAAECGCDLFIEKPLSSSFDRVEELASKVEARGLIACVAYQLRQHPAFRRIQSLLEQAELGKLCALKLEVGEYLPGFHPYEDYRRMYASRNDLGGGVTLTQIHEIDLLYALLGMPERVFSLGGRVSDLEIDVEDVASSLLQYRRSDGRVLPVHLHQDYLQRPPSRRCEIVGDRGRVEWSLSGGNFVRYDALGQSVESSSYADYPRNQLFLDEMTHFLSCVRERRNPEIGIREGAASLKIGLALRESQLSGMPVRLNEVGGAEVGRA